MKERYLTHREVENLCDDFMGKLGWVRWSKGLLNNEGKVRTLPDRIYRKDDEFPLVFEVKPENAKKGEILRGIGQMACYLPYQIRPYLVLSEEQWTTLAEVFSLLPWLGIVVYSGETEKLEIKQRVEREGIEKLTPILLGTLLKIPSEELPIRLRRLNHEQVYYLTQIIRKGKLQGFYLIAELKELMEKAYPQCKVTTSIIGKALSVAGCKKRQKHGRRGYDIQPDLFLP